MTLLPAACSCTGGAAGLPALGTVGIHLLADLHGRKALHVSDVGQRAGQIAMLRVALPVVLNGFGEEFQGFVVASLAANHSSVS